jgi:hypothetical protein
MQGSGISGLAMSAHKSKSAARQNRDTMNYFLWIEEKQQGPYERKQVVDMLLQGIITKQTPCWVEGGTAEWKPVEVAVQSPPAPEGESAFLLNFASGAIFVVGFLMMLWGCLGAVEESTQEERSAIRQGMYTLQFGFGFVILSLGLILRALVRLIRKP